jgi:hypothetical protein
MRKCFLIDIILENHQNVIGLGGVKVPDGNGDRIVHKNKNKRRRMGNKKKLFVFKIR